MKSKPNEAPLRGEAAWRAEKLRIAQSNEQACAKAQDERGRRERAAEVERRAADRRDFANLPVQPHP
ncbi:hypothetical protein [Solirubrobacter soli]|uniref:hypothetical protein n=1 Tax=Solirubrobacter soli TaxID=363832 RepID=UPI0003F4F71E|nr:hypothetical protein [Solirubrobacter soli]